MSHPNDPSPTGRRRAETSRLQLPRSAASRTRVVAAAGIALLLLAVLLAVLLRPGDEGRRSGADTDGRCDLTRLRVGVRVPATAPWFIGDPADGSGFESALVKELSRRLHIQADDVSYVGVPAGAEATVGKGIDVALGQYREPTGEQAASSQDVEFSRGYFPVPQAVLTTTSATTVPRLRDLTRTKLAVIAGSGGARAVAERIRPRQSPTTYADLDGLLGALRTGRADTVVLDLPDAMRARTAIRKAHLVGLVRPRGKGAGKDGADQFKMVFPKGSRYRGCVDDALEELDADGVLAALDKQWLTGALGAPYLR